MATETIISITPFFGREGLDEGGCCEGLDIVTDTQTIVLAVESDEMCSETTGCVTSEAVERFVGAQLFDIKLTDICLVPEMKIERYSTFLLKDIAADEGLMLVDLETDRGVLQFIGYNEHNGYYPHNAMVRCNQLTVTIKL